MQGRSAFGFGIGSLALLVSACTTTPPAPAAPVALAVVPTQQRDSGWLVTRTPDAPQLVDAGSQIAQIGCSTCHAVDLQSASPREGAMPLREMLDDRDPEDLAQKFIAGATLGHAGMPQVTLNGLAADALLAYLKALKVSAEAAGVCHAAAQSCQSPAK